MAMARSWSWGWDMGAGLVFGLSLSCASTVVLLKALETRGMLDTMNGRIAVGWLVVEDLATVILLVPLPPLAGVLGGPATNAAPGEPLWRVSAFVALMLIVGRRALPWLLWRVTRTGLLRRGGTGQGHGQPCAGTLRAGRLSNGRQGLSPEPRTVCASGIRGCPAEPK
jgi:predicted Kef-type K+ transport protein